MYFFQIGSLVTNKQVSMMVRQFEAKDAAPNLLDLDTYTHWIGGEFRRSASFIEVEGVPQP